MGDHHTHKRQVTFYGAISGSALSLHYTTKLAISILALKLSVTTTDSLYKLKKAM